MGEAENRKIKEFTQTLFRTANIDQMAKGNQTYPDGFDIKLMEEEMICHCSDNAKEIYELLKDPFMMRTDFIGHEGELRSLAWKYNSSKLTAKYKAQFPRLREC